MLKTLNLIMSGYVLLYSLFNADQITNYLTACQILQYILLVACHVAKDEKLSVKLEIQSSVLSYKYLSEIK